jgi:hypothetical protein
MTATTRYAQPDAIVDTRWLAGNLRDPSLRVFDCTTHLRYETGTGRPYRVESGRADYDKGHIPGSAFLDLQGELSDGSSRFAFTMPALDDLAARFAARGIGEGTRAVLYSRVSVQWATRVWWMLRAVGFDDAAVLDGGVVGQPKRVVGEVSRVRCEAARGDGQQVGAHRRKQFGELVAGGGLAGSAPLGPEGGGRKKRTRRKKPPRTGLRSRGPTKEHEASPCGALVVAGTPLSSYPSRPRTALEPLVARFLRRVRLFRAARPS